MKRNLFRTQLLAVCVLLPAFHLSAQTNIQTAKLMTFQVNQDELVITPQAIPGSHAELVRQTSGVKIDVSTRDLPAGAYTNWWVIFNRPGECDGPCDFPDVFFNPATAASVLWATGGIVDASGQANFQAELPVGVTPAGDGQLILGNGLLDAHGAEVHYIIKTHGAVQGDPDLQFRQVSSIYGACSDLDASGNHPVDPDPVARVYECWDPQFTAFPPAE